MDPGELFSVFLNVLVLYLCRVVLVSNRSALVTSNISHSHRSFLSTYRWFTIGSIGFVLTGSITLANSYDSGKLMGEDDSTLSLDDYRATWWLVVVSGWFCIFGECFLLLFIVVCLIACIIGTV